VDDAKSRRAIDASRPYNNVHHKAALPIRSPLLDDPRFDEAELRLDAPRASLGRMFARLNTSMHNALWWLTCTVLSGLTDYFATAQPLAQFLHMLERLPIILM
jgi:hypothetical protein